MTQSGHHAIQLGRGRSAAPSLPGPQHRRRSCPLVVDLTGDFVVAPGELRPEILIRCPSLGTAVQTGLRTEAIIFASIHREPVDPNALSSLPEVAQMAAERRLGRHWQ